MSADLRGLIVSFLSDVAVAIRRFPFWAKQGTGLYSGSMVEVIFKRIAPILTVNDLDAALARYRRLGFSTELDESAQYGFVERGMVYLHLQPDDVEDPNGTGGLVYLYVSDAEALHAEWTSAGVKGRFIGPHNTPYGLREFIYTDPDGIVHKVGSPLGLGEDGDGASA
jgi:hypothetical protein